MSCSLVLLWWALIFTNCRGLYGHPKQWANSLQVKMENHRAHMRTKAGYVLVKAFFFSLPTYKASWLISFLKNHRMLESATILIFFFLLQQCHECSVMALSPRKSQICAFCIVLMQFVFPFLVFFVLLFAGTFNTEPLLVLWRRCKDPNTRPEQTREEQNSGEWKYPEDEAIYLCLPGV